jgi:hypothetical protein
MSIFAMRVGSSVGGVLSPRSKPMLRRRLLISRLLLSQQEETHPGFKSG